MSLLRVSRFISPINNKDIFLNILLRFMCPFLGVCGVTFLMWGGYRICFKLPLSKTLASHTQNNMGVSQGLRDITRMGYLGLCRALSLTYLGSSSANLRKAMQCLAFRALKLPFSVLKLVFAPRCYFVFL